MTDNEIIKALEYCKDCSANLNVEIIDLINRQQAEIEQYKDYNAKWMEKYKKARSEAIKEFADRLQIRCIKQDGCLWSSDIGAELKEMVGEE